VNHGLDKALRFAVGSRAIGSRQEMASPQLAQGLLKAAGRSEGACTIGHHLLHRHPVSAKELSGCLQEVAGRHAALVAVDPDKSQPSRVIDGHMDEVASQAEAFSDCSAFRFPAPKADGRPRVGCGPASSHRRE